MNPLVLSDRIHPAAAFIPCLLLVGTLVSAGCASKATDAPTARGPEAANLYTDLAAAYYQRGQYETALERAKQAVAADDRSPNAHYLLGLIDQAIGRTDDAERAFARARQLDPDNPVYLNAAAVQLCRQGQYQQAIRAFETAAETPLYETPEVALSNAAGCALQSGDKQTAAALWQSALRKNPDYPPALLELATMAYSQGRLQQAREYLTGYSSVGEVTPRALHLAEQIETALGNRQAAAQLAATRRERFQDSTEAN